MRVITDGLDDSLTGSIESKMMCISQIRQPWMRSMPANMILLLDAAQTFLVAYYTRVCMTNISGVFLSHVDCVSSLSGATMCS